MLAGAAKKLEEHARSYELVEIKNEKALADNVAPEIGTIGIRYLDHWFTKVIKKLELPLVIILGGIILINLILISIINVEYSNKLSEAKELARPAEIELITITPVCTDCFDINNVIDTLKSKNVKITKETALTKDQASDLIQKYSITKLPSLIVKGEIDKFDLGLTKKDDVLIFDEPEPPYLDLNSNKVEGRVSLTLITEPTCAECIDLGVIVDQLKQLMKISSENALTTNQASDLIQKYSITRIPTIILSKDASVYPSMAKDWNQIGTVESDGMFIARDINSPYLDLTTNEIKGIVGVTYITDKSCTECYNVTVHKQILDNFGVYVDKEETKDIADSTSLISKYGIDKVPTIILSKEASAYPRLTAVWKDVGTVEEDGTYIFRKTELMGVSKDLETGSLIKQS